jgi:hypothetical protein
MSLDQVRSHKCGKVTLDQVVRLGQVRSRYIRLRQVISCYVWLGHIRSGYFRRCILCQFT